MDETPRETILVIMGSTRAGRHCPDIAAWVVAVARGVADLDFETVDLRDWRLPNDDEPGIPAYGGYTQPHTKAWSHKVASASGFVFVTPQYNFGYPAPLKNALDHLYVEWTGKPAGIISYGGHGGLICSAQLLQVIEGMKMRPVPTRPAITLRREVITAGRIDASADLAAFAGTVEQALLELAAMVGEQAR